MKRGSNCFQDYKRLDVEIFRTQANTTAYQIKQTQGAEDGIEAEIVRSAFETAIRTLPLSMGDIIERHFKNDKIKYFHQSDAHKSIEGDSYIRYEWNLLAITIWVGGDSGEVCVLNSADSLVVDRLLTIIQFNK